MCSACMFREIISRIDSMPRRSRPHHRSHVTNLGACSGEERRLCIDPGVNCCLVSQFLIAVVGLKPEFLGTGLMVPVKVTLSITMILLFSVLFCLSRILWLTKRVAGTNWNCLLLFGLITMSTAKDLFVSEPSVCGLLKLYRIVGGCWSLRIILPKLYEERWNA